MTDLVLPTSFEEIRGIFESSKADQKLMEFIEPLVDIEAKIGEIAADISISGKVAFLLGNPGTGKSTFLQSLNWRPHIKVRCLVEIDANDFNSTGSMRGLYDEIAKVGKTARLERDAGPTFLILNYLETLAAFPEADVQAFFRDLNGLLRQTPLFVIWPVTSQDDVDQMQLFANKVSSTMFPRGNAIIDFSGPHEDKFVDIAKRTIAVLNDGIELSEFSMTSNDLEEVYFEFSKLPKSQKNIREYLELIKERWKVASGRQAKIRAGIPKSNEVWFIFSYADAESVVGQFIRKSQRIEDAWSAIHDKLYEYIPNSQRSAKWDAKRLQLALYGAIKTRILFLPTNALISTIAAYGTNEQLRKTLYAKGVPSNWMDKKEAKRSFSNTPLYKQLIGENYPVGKRKGGPAAAALETAEPIFSAVVQWLTSGGSDVSINKAVADVISELTGLPAKNNAPHPWISSVQPDIFIELPHKQVCVEFHYTNRNAPGVIANYVLEKLDVYMDQLEALIKTT